MMVGLPLILFKVRGGRDVGDKEYLCVQEFNGNITRLTGAINTVTSKLSHTISSGKDGYILEAKIVPTGGIAAAVVANSPASAVGDNNSEAKISIATVEKDRTSVGTTTRALTVNNANSVTGTGGSGAGSLVDGIFHAAIGAKGTTGQVIEIENTVDNGSCTAQLVILEVPTGTTPAI